MATADVCHRHGISPATFYKWKSKYGSLEVSEAMLDNLVLKDLGSKMVTSGANGMPSPVPVSITA